ncbi:MAG TPA: nitrate ABC transporter substrate-binding protein [Rhodobacteraceae bacterium]|nr:nitrate ABC transporter substrate-binding protein [Paracoccaceae bacterium]|tara:strand:+ start:1685 stop:2671 length:987 start_codon:yes stop_codon:yes gene_type:complete
MITKLIVSLTATLIASTVWANDKVAFATNWLAQGGHGGFYQALADGTYEKYGLDVDIQMGGPQMNNRPMLPAGKVDFLMTGNLLLSMDSVRNEIPTIVVASYFEKDPQAIIAHKGQYSGWDDLANAPEILVSKDGQFSFWKWMTAEHGFKDESLRPYGYNLAAFLNDKKMVQQAYGTAEPIYAAAAGADVETFLLADQGWSTYSTTIEARVDMVENNPDLVQRFIDASTVGWYNYLYGDNSAGNAAIMSANPDQTLEKLVKETKQLKSLGIIDSGNQLEVGIGAIDMARVQAFYDLAVEAGILEAGSLDVSKVATSQFVNKKVGMDLK